MLLQRLTHQHAPEPSGVGLLALLSRRPLERSLHSTQAPETERTRAGPRSSAGWSVWLRTIRSGNRSPPGIPVHPERSAGCQAQQPAVERSQFGADDTVLVVAHAAHYVTPARGERPTRRVRSLDTRAVCVGRAWPLALDAFTRQVQDYSPPRADTRPCSWLPSPARGGG
jgi:hypothetical protein